MEKTEKSAARLMRLLHMNQVIKISRLNNQNKYIIRSARSGHCTKFGAGLSIFIVAFYKLIYELASFDFNKKTNPEFFIIDCSLWGILIIISICFIVSYFSWKIVVDDGKVEYTNSWGRKTTFHFNDITSYKCKKNKLQNDITLYINNRKVVKIDRECDGRYFLIRDIEKYKIKYIK